MIDIHDHVLADPDGYRAAALRLPFQSVCFGPVTFHGIMLPPTSAFVDWFAHMYPDYLPTLTFLRRSPAGQIEPNFIHTDVDMGDVTALLYLNPAPPEGDGTRFWRWLTNGAVSGGILTGDAGKRLEDWTLETHVAARFNRSVVFAAPRFHSRALADNYGEGDDARLVQVLFARWKEI